MNFMFKKKGIKLKKLSNLIIGNPKHYESYENLRILG
jgi:hypothetical protein